MFKLSDEIMLRILLCVTCCSVPPKERVAVKRKTSAAVSANNSPKQEKNKNIESTTNEQQLASSSERAGANKDNLLANQIQTNNENYKKGSIEQQGKTILPLEGALAPLAKSQTVSTERDASIESAASKLETAAAIKRQNAIDESIAQAEIDSYDDNVELVKARRQTMLKNSPIDGASVSPPSSIEIDQYTEGSSNIRLPGASFDDYEAQVAKRTNEQDNDAEEAAGTATAVAAADDDYSTGTREATTARDTFVSSVGSTSSARNVPSTTKIGDYARIEYSPVEDLDSVTTMSQSRGGSERGTRSQPGSLAALSRQNSLKATTNDNMSHRSSQGIESTSISIASQLSNEQLQQNLTNMLESVNAPYPLFGTIGLPLGPPLEGTYTETAKTSPETPGAALTSASQDSLSDTSIGSSKLNRQATFRSDASSGAALVGDSVERSPLFDDSADLAAAQAPLASGEDEKENAQRASEQNLPSSQRIGSPQSIVTTTSGGLTNPTPTPSELSTSSNKKKKLKAKSFLKRLKPSSKKKNKDE